jgi:hypothetical protein
MKKLRVLFLAAAFAFGLGANRAQGQTMVQNLTFSIICQYVTNFLNVTNITTGNITSYEELDTIVVNTANVIKAIDLQKFGTNWTQWYPANIFYEVDLTTGAQGIYLRREGVQTNVSEYFGTCFSNYFSQNADTALAVTNYAANSLPLGGNPNDQTPALTTNINHFANLAYLSFTNTNMSFSLFGFTQGQIVLTGGYFDGTFYKHYSDVGELISAGTFTLNVTTNVFNTNTTLYPAIHATGIAHGTIYIGTPVFFPFGAPEGP